MEIQSIDQSTIRVIVDGNLYSSNVIHKCFYWYGDKYSVNITSDGTDFRIELSELTKEGSIERIIPKIKTDLIDFKTREIISSETKNIREILIAKAFAHGEELEALPSGNIADPIGFDPSKI